MPGNGRTAEGKEPIGTRWGLERWTLERANREFKRWPGAGVGICLGPGRAPGGAWLIDVEGDGPEAEASRAKLFGGEDVETIGWGSTRGGHQLLIADPDQLGPIMPGLKPLEGKGTRAGVFKSAELPGLELRLGGFKADGIVKQVQSVVPPTPGTDGSPREWSGGQAVAPAPSAFYQALAGLVPQPEPWVDSFASNPDPVVSLFTQKPARLRATSGQGAIESRESATRKYVLSALEAEERALSAAAEGDRNNQLNRSAFALGQLVGAGVLARAIAENVLRDAASRIGLSPGEIGPTIASGLNDGAAKPRDMSGVGTKAGAASPVGKARQKTESPGPKGVYIPDAEEQAGDDRPTIICGSEDQHEGLKTWTPQAINALRILNDKSPSVFQRMKKLSRLSLPVEDDESPTIETLGNDALRGVLDRAAFWGNVEITRKGAVVHYGPPRLDIVRDIMSLGTLDPMIFPPLEAVTETPLFGPDGRLILEPGYHREAKLYYAPREELQGINIPDNPSDDDIAGAMGIIFGELFCDFPFANQASKANALAVMLLPFVRLIITGPTPNHHFTASTEGTGKGLCAAACAFPFLGRDIDINPQKESEAEWRKALTSFLLSGESHYFIDNIRNPLGWDDVPLDIESGTLCAAWTGGRWRDRILGGQEEARVKLHAVFMSSGNNVAFSRELTRRIVPIELQTPCENPSARTGFKHDPILDWALEHRTELLRACLILCRNWIAQGMKPGVIPYGSYSSYSKTMGGILEACGVRGFLENLPDPESRKDRESLRWPALVEAWHKHRGGLATSTGQIYEVVFGGKDDQGRDHDGIPELQVAFADVVGEGKELSRKQKFGHAIGRQDGRIWAGFRIVRTSANARNGSSLYRLEATDDAWPEDRE